MIARCVVVRGRVQGVGYRYAMVEAAIGCGVTGWVRNRRDGTVEAQIEGEPDAVERAIAWCRRGPPQAKVTAVEVTEVPLAEPAGGFGMRPTE
jgi:acylphosphatase